MFPSSAAALAFPVNMGSVLCRGVHDAAVIASNEFCVAAVVALITPSQEFCVAAVVAPDSAGQIKAGISTLTTPWTPATQPP